jgi:ATP-binding cassette subfamily A (ABC1) protein 3
VGAPFKYSSVLLLNSTSQSIAGAYGAMIHTAFLKDYLSQNGKLADGFKLEFVD